MWRANQRIVLKGLRYGSLARENALMVAGSLESLTQQNLSDTLTYFPSRLPSHEFKLCVWYWGVGDGGDGGEGRVGKDQCRFYMLLLGPDSYQCPGKQASGGRWRWVSQLGHCGRGGAKPLCLPMSQDLVLLWLLGVWGISAVGMLRDDDCNSAVPCSEEEVEERKMGR